MSREVTCTEMQARMPCVKRNSINTVTVTLTAFFSCRDHKKGSSSTFTTARRLHCATGALLVETVLVLHAIVLGRSNRQVIFSTHAAPLRDRSWPCGRDVNQNLDAPRPKTSSLATLPEQIVAPD